VRNLILSVYLSIYLSIYLSNSALSSLTGFLIEKELASLEKVKKYFCLYGNLLYIYDTDNSSSLNSVLFLEGSTVKISSNSLTISISTLSGKTTSLSSEFEQPICDWYDTIESSKVISMQRKIEDLLSQVEQQQNQIGEYEIIGNKYEKIVDEKMNYIDNIQNEKKKLDLKINNLEYELKDTSSRLKSSEDERLLVLKARGVTPKRLPLWAITENENRRGVRETIDSLKIWVGTWNLSCCDPFGGMTKEKASEMLQDFVPLGYDIYCFGIQEAISESVFEAIEGLLSAEGFLKLNLGGLLDPIVPNSRLNSTNININFNDPRIYSSRKGTLSSQKYIGMSIFVARNYFHDVKLCSVVNHEFTSPKDGAVTGGICTVLSVFGKTLAFVNCQLDQKKKEFRRDQIRELIINLGSKSGEKGWNLNEQFHHILWCGDLNYRLVDSTGNLIPEESSCQMLEDNLSLTLFDKHDELNQEKRNKFIFYGFREPTPAPDFFPSYKKISNRQKQDYSKKDWVKKTYQTAKKDNFWNQEKKSCLGYSDRILYHSLVDLAKDLLPQCLKTEMLVYNKTDNEQSVSELRKFTSSGSINALVDNYRTINDGDGFNVSEHSPVFATFLLRLQHNHEDIRKHATNIASSSSSGGINTLLSALDNEVDVRSNNISNDSIDSPLASFSKDLNSSLTDFSMTSLEEEKIEKKSLILVENSSPKLYKFSLLPPAIYRIRISQINLIWGSSEEPPLDVKILFPAPYESPNGQDLADFYSEDRTTSSSPIKQQPNDKTSNVNNTTPLKNKKSHIVSRNNTPIKDNNKDNDISVSTNGWKKTHSVTQSSICVESKRPTRGMGLPALNLLWHGDIPLDRLHICVQAKMEASRFSNSQQTFEKSDDSYEDVTGRCSIDLEKLCKVALVYSGGINGTVSVSRILLRDSAPLYNICPKMIQVNVLLNI
jgi:hypothetical protein